MFKCHSTCASGSVGHSPKSGDAVGFGGLGCDLGTVNRGTRWLKGMSRGAVYDEAPSTDDMPSKDAVD